MKTLIAALLLSTLAAPVLAMDVPMVAIDGITASDVLFPSVDEFGRRSGNCPSRPGIARVGSVCGGA
jgi:hypothetical protein